MDMFPHYNPGLVKAGNVNLTRMLETILDSHPGGADADASLCSNRTAPPPSYATYRLFRVAVDVYLVTTVCLLGFLGNGLTIVILCSDNDKRSTTNWLLQTLAVVDIVYLVACLFIQPLKTARDVTDWLPPAVDHLFVRLQPYVWALASTAQMVTVWTVLLVTVDRYIAICHPLKNKVRTLDRARVAVLVVVLVAIVYNIPLVLENGVSVEDVDRTPLDCRGWWFHQPPSVARMTRRSFLYFLVYRTVCSVVFRSVGPMVALVTLNLKLVRALGRMRRRHRHLATSTCRQRESVTLTLVVVVSVFVVCEVPDVCLRLAVTSWEWIPTMEIDVNVTLRLVNPLTNMLLTVNSSVNFLIYCLIGKKFRRILFRLCVRGRRGGGGGRLPVSDRRVSGSQLASAKTYEMVQL